MRTFADESWEQYPGAFNRMINLLKGRRGAMVVSGDVHRNAACDWSSVATSRSSGGSAVCASMTSGSALICCSSTDAYAAWWSST